VPLSRLVDLSQLLSSDQLSQTKLADETGVILDVDSLQVFSLNETAMFLVEELQAGATSRERLVERLLQDFAVDEATAAADVDHFVAELVKHLLDRRKGSAAPAGGEGVEE
jgi:hypothetical protein